MELGAYTKGHRVVHTLISFLSNLCLSNAEHNAVPDRSNTCIQSKMEIFKLHKKNHKFFKYIPCM